MSRPRQCSPMGPSSEHQVEEWKVGYSGVDVSALSPTYPIHNLHRDQCDRSCYRH
jgi:hypothetical protein